jgi:hypothetical protein
MRQYNLRQAMKSVVVGAGLAAVVGCETPMSTSDSTTLQRSGQYAQTLAPLSKDVNLGVGMFKAGVIAEGAGLLGAIDWSGRKWVLERGMREGKFIMVDGKTSNHYVWDYGSPGRWIYVGRAEDEQTETNIKKYLEQVGVPLDRFLKNKESIVDMRY